MEPCGSEEDAEWQRLRKDFSPLRGTWQTKGRQPDTYAAVRALCISLLDDALSLSPQTAPNISFKLNELFWHAEITNTFLLFLFCSFLLFLLSVHYFMFLPLFHSPWHPPLFININPSFWKKISYFGCLKFQLRKYSWQLVWWKVKAFTLKVALMQCDKAVTSRTAACCRRCRQRF